MPDAVSFSPFGAAVCRQVFVRKIREATSSVILARLFGMVCGIDDLLATGIEFEFPVKSAAIQN